MLPPAGVGLRYLGRAIPPQAGGHPKDGASRPPAQPAYS